MDLGLVAFPWVVNHSRLVMQGNGNLFSQFGSLKSELRTLMEDLLLVFLGPGGYWKTLALPWLWDFILIYTSALALGPTASALSLHLLQTSQSTSRVDFP